MQQSTSFALSRTEARTVLEQEFDDRFEAVRPRLLAICRAVVGPADAEDLVQDTYLRARARLEQLRDPDLLEAWLARVALNEARSLARRTKRQRDQLRQLAPTEATEPDAELARLVDALPPIQRAAVALYYGYGYRVRELAELLGISEINARTVLFRARRQLRRQLRENRP
jgi:RNA polymerase sigma factor (sigma-70 family)